MQLTNPFNGVSGYAVHGVRGYAVYGVRGYAVHDFLYLIFQVKKNR
jgi:hypothetical protein